MQSREHSVPQLHKELVSFARSRLGIDALHSGTVPFIFRVNAALKGGWLGGIRSESPKMLSAVTREAAPPQKTAQQVESLRNALRLRMTANSSNSSKPQLHPNSSAAVQPPSEHADRAHNRSPPSSGVKNVTVFPLAPASAIELAKDGHSTSTFLKTVKWMNDEDAPRCCECNAAFTVFNRRHHCRVCGRLVDSRCCSKFYINNTIVNQSVGVASDFHRIVELVCYPCQKDIQRGVPLQHASRSRARAWHSTGTPAHGRPTRELSDSDEYSLNVRPGKPSSGTRASGEIAARVDSEGGGSPNNAPEPGVRNILRQRREAVIASPLLDVSLDMQLSDLHHDALHSASESQREIHGASNDLPTRDLPPKQGPQFRKNGAQRLPSRAFRDDVHSSNIARQDQFTRAHALLDSVVEDCADAALVPLVADQIYHDAFVGWAETSLGLPSHVAASAAAAAYRQTDEVRKAAMHSFAKIPRAGVPRSLFPMLLLNLKLELQRQEICIHAENSLGSKALTKKPIGKLPIRMKGGSSGIFESSLQREEGLYDAWSNRTANHSKQQEDLQVGIAVNEIESILQSTGFRGEECHKVAAELASAGARDMRTIVQLLQQDNTTLAKAGLQPSHVLRVLRNMAKQPVFAAEAPSFRLTLDDD